MYDELYTSDTWIAAHDEIQKQKQDNRCKLERVIAVLMLWSDATHLAQFSIASAWPSSGTNPSTFDLALTQGHVTS